MKALALVLFHDDEDIVIPQLNYMIQNNHDIIVFSHNSVDKTDELIKNFNNKRIIDKHFISAEVKFKGNHVFKYIDKYVEPYLKNYDWITFIESDEFLEGPDRKKSYYEYLCDVAKTDATYVMFESFVFWYTEKDDNNIKNPIERMKYYCYDSKCAKKIYAWKASVPRKNVYNHSPPKIKIQSELIFKTRHYEGRSKEHIRKKLMDRVKQFPSGGINHHYKIMYDNISKLDLKAEQLHYDNGTDELIYDNKINWRKYIR